MDTQGGWRSKGWCGVDWSEHHDILAHMPAREIGTAKSDSPLMTLFGDGSMGRQAEISKRQSNTMIVLDISVTTYICFTKNGCNSRPHFRLVREQAGGGSENRWSAAL